MSADPHTIPLNQARRRIHAAANGVNDPTSLPAYHAIAKHLMANPR